MAESAFPDGRRIVIEDDGGSQLLDYLESCSPDLWSKLCRLRGCGELRIDLAAGRIQSPKAAAPADDEGLLKDLRLLAEISQRAPARALAEETIAGVILCGGVSTRMERQDCNKVSIPIAGRSVINRSLSRYKAAGIRTNVVVLGWMGRPVMADILAEHPDTLFVYQAERRGTGHAARQAAYLLESQGFRGSVFVTLGDKVIERTYLDKLLATWRSAEAALLVTTAPKERWPAAGRVIYRDDGTVDCSVERIDITKKILLARMRAELASGALASNREAQALVAEYLPYPQKAKRVLGDALWECLSAPRLEAQRVQELIGAEDLAFRVNHADGEQRSMSAEELEQLADEVNISVYVFRADALYGALARLGDDNAQHEQYLTDAIHILSRERDVHGRYRNKVLTVEVDDPDQVLAFNTPDEFEYVRHHILRTHPS